MLCAILAVIMLLLEAPSLPIAQGQSLPIRARAMLTACNAGDCESSTRFKGRGRTPSLLAKAS